VTGRNSQSPTTLLAAVGFGLLVLVIFVIVKNSGGDGAPPKLTVCESAWREAARSAAESGVDNDRQVQPTLTACDTVAEWDAANLQYGSKVGEGAAVIDRLCTDLRVTSTRLCTEAKQQAALPAS
jgi:hypothetical protein